MTWRRSPALDEDRPQETPAAIEDMDRRGPGADRLHLRHHRRAARRRPRLRYLAGQTRQAEHWLGLAPGELVWCTTAPGWSKSAATSSSPLADRRRGA
jgi:hypothetical protein